MSLVLFKPALDIWKPGAHSGTFRGNNMAFVTASQALDSYWADEAFATDVQRKAGMVRDWLENLVHSYPMADLSVRGRGLIQGLVIETSGANDEVLKVLPALTIPEEQLKAGLEIIERSVAQVLHEKGVSSSAHVLKFGGKRR